MAYDNNLVEKRESHVNISSFSVLFFTMLKTEIIILAA